MNYDTQVDWDINLIDVWYTDIDNPLVKGLVTSGVYIVTGAPVATADKFIPGALIKNAVSGLVYQNTGSTAAPVWVALENSASGFTLPLAEADAATTTTTSFALAMSALTTGIAQSITAGALTTGKIFRAIATAATLTSGRYFEANDGTTNVWGIGANGHMHSAQTTAPTITPTTPNGITAAAITAGSTDVCGTITTTGTNNAGGATVLDITFNKTYTVAPKAVHLQALNTSASKAAATSLFTAIVSAKSATGFTITIPSDASAGATPSWSYMVIA